MSNQQSLHLPQWCNGNCWRKQDFCSGTYLSLTWNFGKDKASYDQFDKIISGDTIHNWIYCHIIDSNGNIFDTKTDSETFSSVYFDSNDSGDEHWNNSGESTYVDDDGNYCFQTNILLPALTQTSRLWKSHLMFILKTELKLIWTLQPSGWIMNSIVLAYFSESRQLPAFC